MAFRRYDYNIWIPSIARPYSGPAVFRMFGLPLIHFQFAIAGMFLSCYVRHFLLSDYLEAQSRPRPRDGAVMLCDSRNFSILDAQDSSLDGFCWVCFVPDYTILSRWIFLNPLPSFWPSRPIRTGGPALFLCAPSRSWSHLVLRPLLLEFFLSFLLIVARLHRRFQCLDFGGRGTSSCWKPISVFCVSGFMPPSVLLCSLLGISLSPPCIRRLSSLSTPQSSTFFPFNFPSFFVRYLFP